MENLQENQAGEHERNARIISPENILQLAREGCIVLVDNSIIRLGCCDEIYEAHSFRRLDTTACARALKRIRALESLLKGQNVYTTEGTFKEHSAIMKHLNIKINHCEKAKDEQMRRTSKRLNRLDGEQGSGETQIRELRNKLFAFSNLLKSMDIRKSNIDFNGVYSHIFNCVSLLSERMYLKERKSTYNPQSSSERNGTDEDLCARIYSLSLLGRPSILLGCDKDFFNIFAACNKVFGAEYFNKKFPKFRKAVVENPFWFCFLVEGDSATSDSYTLSFNSSKSGEYFWDAPTKKDVELGIIANVYYKLSGRNVNLDGVVDTLENEMRGIGDSLSARNTDRNVLAEQLREKML